MSTDTPKRERPILFSAPMVRALLAGTKTQTRRIVKPWEPRPSAKQRPVPADVAYLPDFTCYRATCPYGQPGDRLWVRETWARDDEDGCMMYRADLGRDVCADAWEQGRIEGVPRYRWRPSIHMPRWASRITLDITAVRVERLQDISEADALAEGIVETHGGYGLPDGSYFHGADPRQSYLALWETINGRESVEANPFVWVVEFRRTQEHA